MTPTLKEQMEWLDRIKRLLHSDNAPMILAIKENLIAVRNIQVAIETKLDKINPAVEQAFKDLVERGECIVDYRSLGLSTEKPLLQFFEDEDTGDTMQKLTYADVQKGCEDLYAKEVEELDSYMKETHLDQIITTIESIERYNENNPEKPFEFRSEFLNDRERNLLSGRIERLRQQVQREYSIPKSLRRPGSIKAAQERIATLKKWMNESTLDR